MDLRESFLDGVLADLLKRKVKIRLIFFYLIVVCKLSSNFFHNYFFIFIFLSELLMVKMLNIFKRNAFATSWLVISDPLRGFSHL